MTRVDHAPVIMCLRCGWRRSHGLLRHARDIAKVHPTATCPNPDIVCRWLNTATGVISGGARTGYEVV